MGSTKNIVEIECSNDRLRSDLLPCLRKSVFHVTTIVAMEGIVSDGFVRSNNDERYPFTYPQSQKSYGRSRGYVCLFDVRSISTPDLDEVLAKFWFLNPSSAGNRPVFLLMNEMVTPKLIPWTTAREAGYREMWIPNAECWYPGDIPVSEIETILRVNVVPHDRAQ